MIVLRQAMQATVSRSPSWIPLPRPCARRRHLCEPTIAQAFRHTPSPLGCFPSWCLCLALAKDKCVAISATDDKRQTTNVSLGCACAKYLGTGAHSTAAGDALIQPGTSRQAWTIARSNCCVERTWPAKCSRRLRHSKRRCLQEGLMAGSQWKEENMVK